MLGQKIRDIRKSRSITIKELAERTDLSIGYISQIERDLTDPSLSTLRKISGALDVPTYIFMDYEPGDNFTIRKENVIVLSQPDTPIRYHLLSPMPFQNFVPQSLIIRFELDAQSRDGERPVVHPSEEIILAEEGELDIYAGSEIIHLRRGDSTLLRSNVPHIVGNPTKHMATGVSVFTPAIWFPQMSGRERGAE